MTRGAAAKQSLEDVVRETAEKLSAITSKLEKLDSMELTMADIRAENRQLREALAFKDDEIRQLNHRLNELEQYTRGGSIRVLNVPLTDEEELNNTQVATKLYKTTTWCSSRFSRGPWTVGTSTTFHHENS